MKATKLSATIENKVARFNYIIEETFIAGIILTGPEVCSLRLGMANINDGWCYVTNDEKDIYIKNMHITSHTNANNSFVSFDENAERKLLLTKAEIKKLAKATSTKGMTIVPLKVYRSDNGLYKVLIGLAKGKKDYDKRETIKERDITRELSRTMKIY